MQHFIITEPYRNMRARARQVLTGKWLPVITAVLFYFFFATLIPEFFSEFVPIGIVEQELFDGTKTSMSVVPAFYNAFLGGVFSVGLASFMLGFLKCRDTNPTHVFDGFEFYVRCFTVSTIKMVIVFAFSLLFLIPGIVMLFRYSQAEFILAEDPKKGAFQCLRESKEMMIGNKRYFFLLELSFIGWGILASLPVILIMRFIPSDNQILSFIAFAVCLIPISIYYTYERVTATLFYQFISAPYKMQKEQLERQEQFRQWS